MNIGVIGAGIVGSATARVLSKRGHSVTLYEQFPLGHDRGSSHGRSRIVRRAYPDVFFTSCMSEAYPLWADLEAETGQRLVTECGLAYLGRRDAAQVVAMIHALEEVQVPHRIFEPRVFSEEAPVFKLDPTDLAIVTPEAGWVDAEGALRVCQTSARNSGTVVKHQKTTQVEAEKVHDRVVVAAGPWIQDFIRLDTTVTLQTFGYMSPSVPGPVWIDDASMTYGIPGDPTGHKIGAHLPGPEFNPEDETRPILETQKLQLESVALRRFGQKEVSSLKTCLYTSTPNEDFRFGALSPKSIFASACSGHGFKMGLWVGQLLADLAEGRAWPTHLDRFWVSPESLRSDTIIT